VYYSNYTYSQLRPLILLMLDCCEDPLKHHAAIYEKYLDKRYKKAASYVQNEMHLGFRVPHENVSCTPALSYGGESLVYVDAPIQQLWAQESNWSLIK